MELKIFIDRLKEGQVERIEGSLSTAILHLEDTDLSLKDTFTLVGEAYIAQPHLILKLKARAAAYLPCNICNEPVEVPLVVEDFYHTKPLEEIPSAIFDFSEALREDILLQVPQFAECCGGNCPERDRMKKFLQKDSSQKNQIPSCHYPFSGLNG